jgi:hypothetical protein
MKSGIIKSGSLKVSTTARKASVKNTILGRKTLVKANKNISIVFERSAAKSAIIALRKMNRINLEHKYADYLKK